MTRIATKMDAVILACLVADKTIGSPALVAKAKI